MLFDIKPRILDYIHNLGIYDYFAFAWVGIFFLLLLVIAITQIKKRVILSVLLILIAFILLLLSPIAIKIFFDNSIKKVELIDKKVLKLNFSKMLILEGKIKNRAKIDFKKCRVMATINNIYSDKYKTYLNYLKPLRKMSIVLNNELKKEKSYPYKIVFKDFNTTKEYGIKVYGECY